MLKLAQLSKTYLADEIETTALREISLEIAQGDFLAIMGPSGCGKSTLLNILGLLDSPSGGEFWFLGQEVARWPERKLTLLRRQTIGFVFQSFNLIDDLTVAENVELALLYQGVAPAERKRRVTQALEQVNVAHRASHRPKQLSGGQQQRVAVARALVGKPKLILADEPTGNLDTANGDQVMGLLTDVAQAGTTVIMVTHSPSHAAYAQRQVHMLDGQIVAATLLAA